MSDEKEPRSRSGAPSHQVTGTLEGSAVHPARLEAQGVQLLAEHCPHLTNAIQVHRAAVHVHDPLQERHCLGVASLNLLHDGELGGREVDRCLGGGGLGLCCPRQRQDEREGEAGGKQGAHRTPSGLSA